MTDKTEHDEGRRGFEDAPENEQRVDDELVGELGDRGEDLADGVPESLTIEVSLPAPMHSMPEDEIAVAIDEVAVNPGEVVLTSTTTSVQFTPPIVDSIEAAEPGGSTYNRRGQLRRGAADGPEPAAMLTAERLLGGHRKAGIPPEGRWPWFVHTVTFGTVNLGDSAAVSYRKRIDARIHKEFNGGTRFVPVLTRKGGVGKTTVTALLGMALADVREDRIIAIDANPDRGTLSERVNKQTQSTVRDVVTKAASVSSFSDFTHLVSRDETRLDILASDTDPLLSEAFDEDDYNVVADLCARFYSIALTDCGTGIVHSVMRATLQRADAVVIVSGGSVDEARLASETLTWLEANGYGDLVRNAVVALNTATPGTNLVNLDEIEAHFRSRVREIVRIPYDPQLAAGSVVYYKELKPLTKSAARELAALVVDGLPQVRSD
ncbi:MAG: MinD/ParA family protein [Microbacteriaceae bacterium]|nr:MinD/ParA family protein [Microbacteriaceae bacterium]